MADDVNFQANWSDETTQCKNCKAFQSHDGKNACVPPDKTFEEAIKTYGEVPENAHCDYFQKK